MTTQKPGGPPAAHHEPGPDPSPAGVSDTPPDTSPDFLARTMAAAAKDLTAALDGEPTVKRRKVTFVLDPEAARSSPGVFPAPFELTLQSLTGKEELEAVQGAEDMGGAAVGLALARAGLAAVNGTPVGIIEREWLWEHLGTGGRMLCVMMGQEVGAISPVALGKARASLRRG